MKNWQLEVEYMPQRKGVASGYSWMVNVVLRETTGERGLI